MNFKYVFGFFSLIYLVSQACAWKWQNALALNEALENFINKEDHPPFLGMDITEMSYENKMKICTDVATKVDLPLQPSGTSELEVGMNMKYYFFVTRKFSVFSCGESAEKTYYFGKGPRENTIAVYILPKNEKIGRALGIMDYSLQANAWKWYEGDALTNALKNFIRNKEIYPFTGKDVNDMSENDKKKICTDAETEKKKVMSLEAVMQFSDVRELEIRVIVDDSYEDVSFWVFSCGETEKETFFFGKGPCENTIAVYSLRKNDKFPFAHGIMDYSWQPQQ